MSKYVLAFITYQQTRVCVFMYSLFKFNLQEDLLLIPLSSITSILLYSLPTKVNEIYRENYNFVEISRATL